MSQLDKNQAGKILTIKDGIVDNVVSQESTFSSSKIMSIIQGIEIDLGEVWDALGDVCDTLEALTDKLKATTVTMTTVESEQEALDSPGLVE